MRKLTLLIAIALACLALSSLLASGTNGVVIAGWMLVAPLPQPLAYHRAAVYGDTIYVIGGEVPVWTTPEAPLLQAKVEADGSILQWVTPIATFATPLPHPLDRHALVQAHWDTTDSLYVIGGYSKGNRYADVWRANRITTTSQLSGWQEVRNYPRKIVLHEAVFSSGHLYVLGGLDEDNRPLKEIYSAKINLNSELEAWTARQELPMPLYRFALVRYTVMCRHYLFVIGGYDGENLQRRVYLAEANYNGGLSEWNEQEPLPRALTYHQAIIHRNRLIVIGGSGTNGSYNEVYSTSIDPTNGSIGKWESEADLPASITRFSVVSVTLSGSQATELYVLGGRNGDDFQSQVYRSYSSSTWMSTGITEDSRIFLPLIRSC
jgi:hypothetical protein